MSKFIHLHTHSHYSLLNALPKIPELVQAAKDREMDALALTDNGNLYGAIEFYKSCKKKNIKPIIGIDGYTALRSRHDKEAGIDNRRHRLVLLAENEKGYKNLIRLVTYSHIEGFYYRPRMDWELLERYADSLIAILPSYSGEVAALLRQGDTAQADTILTKFKNIFGNENVFLEVTHHPEIEGHSMLQRDIAALSAKTGTPLVAGQEVYYIAPEDRAARNTLMSVASGAHSGTRGFDDVDEDFSFIDNTEASERFLKFPGAIENTNAIAQRCNLELALGKWVFPNVELKEGTSYDDRLREIVMEGLATKQLKRTEELNDRLAYELDIIKKKGYAPYFLVVEDLLSFAHDNGILSTIRGSVAGSLVTYLAGITKINPLEFKLPFERFLNPERPSAPDIDMDFADNRRDEVIDYARQKYGEDRVAQIGTFGTMMARGAVRDTARALGYDYGTGDRIARLIPFGMQGFPMTIDRALESEDELQKLYDTDTSSKEVIDMAKKIEGCARHISVHAAGVVISPVPLTEIVPTQLDPRGGKLITQYDMHAVEDAGLLKFDFLGLKNLAVLADAIKRVHDLYDVDIDIENISLSDEKTFAMLSRGETMGVFQLSGSGMTRFLKELRPSQIHDINAMVALYRPGPMESIPSYIKRKHNPDEISYLDPRMEEILSQSYGVITYQDDVLLIARRLAGYSWLEADKLRKAMGKKIPAEMAAQKEKFIAGCVSGGIAPIRADQIWRLIEPFAAYGFNKAHAASYGRVAYQTAYIKANYPVPYMAAVLSADSGDVEKIAEAVAECKRMHIPVLPPDVNLSFKEFTVVNENDQESIRFGLSTIKNFGEGIAQAIIDEREQNGTFASIADFLERVNDRNLNKKSVEALIMSGALDQLGERGQLLENLDDLLAYSRGSMSKPDNQDSLFGLMDDNSTIPTLTLRPAPPSTMIERLAWERELLGLYISGHPLDQYADKLPESSLSIDRIKNDLQPEMKTAVAGILEDVRQVLTKKGERMAFLKLTDKTGSIEAVAFPKMYKEHKDIFEQNTCVTLRGRISNRGGVPSIVAEHVAIL